MSIGRKPRDQMRLCIEKPAIYRHVFEIGEFLDSSEQPSAGFRRDDAARDVHSFDFTCGTISSMGFDFLRRCCPSVEFARRTLAQTVDNRFLNFPPKFPNAFCPQFGNLWELIQIPKLVVRQCRQEITNIVGGCQLCIPGNCRPQAPVDARPPKIASLGRRAWQPANRVRQCEVQRREAT